MEPTCEPPRPKTVMEQPAPGARPSAGEFRDIPLAEGWLLLSEKLQRLALSMDIDPMVFHLTDRQAAYFERLDNALLEKYGFTLGLEISVLITHGPFAGAALMLMMEMVRRWGTGEAKEIPLLRKLTPAQKARYMGESAPKETEEPKRETAAPQPARRVPGPRIKGM